MMKKGVYRSLRYTLLSFTVSATLSNYRTSL